MGLLETSLRSCILQLKLLNTFVLGECRDGLRHRDNKAHHQIHLISPAELVHSNECFLSKGHPIYSRHVGHWILRLLEAGCNTSVISIPGAWHTGGVSLTYLLDEPK